MSSSRSSRMTAALVSGLCLVLAAGPALIAQPIRDERTTSRPALVLAIMVDQMRADYLDRFGDLFGPGGFKRLTQGGAVFTRCQYEHAPTNTAPGHSLFLSGLYPRESGIITNEWYSVAAGRTIYCVEDSSVRGVGIDPLEATGRMSPRNLNGTTLGDELRKIDPASKIISISLKDRGAILPAGHHPTGAYWFDARTGNWITSSYYRRTLPDWVDVFNRRRLPETALGQDWTKLLPQSAYVRQGPDDAPGEGVIPGESTTTFPHHITDPGAETTGAGPRRFDAFLPTPWANDLTVGLAESAIAAERLGQRGSTDLLALSFSAPDYCGHLFGPDSHEIEDIIVRLDRQLAGFFAYVDSAVGLQRTVIVLTADHGVSPMPERFPSEHAARVNAKDFLVDLKVRVGQELNYNEGNDNLIQAVSNDDVYLDKAGIEAHGFDRSRFASSVVRAVLREEHVRRAITRTELERSIAIGGSPDPLQRRIEHGFHPKLSGDVVLLLREHCFFSESTTGTAHGTPYEYDAAVPLLIAGPGVRHGVYDVPCSPNDISATLAAMLGVARWSGCSGIVRAEAISAEIRPKHEASKTR